MLLRPHMRVRQAHTTATSPKIAPSRVYRWGVLLASVALVFGLSHSGWQSAAAAGATLMATPNPVTIVLGQTQGSTTLTWSGAGQFGLITVQRGNNPEVPVNPVFGAAGSMVASVTAGDNLFRLKGEDLTSVLATVDVKGQFAVAHVPQPNAGNAAGGLGSGQTSPSSPILVGNNQPNICIGTCGGPAGPASPPTLTLQASRIVHSVTGSYDQNNPPWCPFREGVGWGTQSALGLGLFNDDVPVAWGYEHEYDPGSDPLNCWESWDWSVQTAIGFDWDAMTRFTLVHGLKSAVLQGTSAVGDTNTCTLHLWATDAPWDGVHSGPNVDLMGTNSGQGNWVPATLTPQNNWTADITQIFFWPAPSTPLLHFVFVGPVDPSGDHDNARNHCEFNDRPTLTITGDH